MSDEQKSESEPSAEEQSKGLNLTLAYSLLAFAIVAALCIALFIVMPFYHRR
ncbi:hypothetical protein P8935_21130 [Telmatobacter sp. DSM 110680]|uniref:Uncharacterized protein n=1 Tax=Telmatobacter sp. DSM 110680 TaxID=3036704 RepID=A0AAU7DI96_9BACT